MLKERMVSQGAANKVSRCSTVTWLASSALSCSCLLLGAGTLAGPLLSFSASVQYTQACYKFWTADAKKYMTHAGSGTRLRRYETGNTYDFHSRTQTILQRTRQAPSWSPVPNSRCKCNYSSSSTGTVHKPIGVEGSSPSLSTAVDLNHRQETVTVRTNNLPKRKN
jgi:hypothetical protein